MKLEKLICYLHDNYLFCASLTFDIANFLKMYKYLDFCYDFSDCILSYQGTEITSIKNLYSTYFQDYNIVSMNNENMYYIAVLYPFNKRKKSIVIFSKDYYFEPYSFAKDEKDFIEWLNYKLKYDATEIDCHPVDYITELVITKSIQRPYQGFGEMGEYIKPFLNIIEDRN